MKELGANAIRVYHVDPDQDHDQCMQIFADNGIYLFLDLDTFDTAINQNKPTWTDEQYSAFAKVMDAFAKYENMAGFFVGNEVISTTAGATAAPYILAAVADMKRYRDSKNYRKIPIGYSAADIAELRPMLQNYLVCHKDEENRVDFFALNSYEWCGENTFQGSGYASLQKQAEGYPVPIWFSEIGCNAVRPRTFQDLNAILGPEMNSVWSGGMAYEWIQEENDYGIVTYAAPPQPDSVSTPIPISPDFNELQSRFATLAPSGVALSDYKKQTATVSLPPCPKSSAEWALNPDAHLPTLGSRVAVLSVAEGSVTTTAHSTTGTTLLGKVNASPTPSAVSTSASTSEVSATVTNSGMYTAVPTVSYLSPQLLIYSFLRKWQTNNWCVY